MTGEEIAAGQRVTGKRGRGYAEELPDVAVWLERSKTLGVVVLESGGRRDLEPGWAGDN